MTAVSQHGGRVRPPELLSWAARGGVAVLVGLSIYIGCAYWYAIDPPLAALTVGAELVAFAGLAVALWQWRRSRWLGFGAAAVTAIAAAWCAFTMFQKIDADTRAEAVRAAMERPQYVFAASAAETAGGLLDARLRHPNPRPTCTCPQTIEAWEAAEAAAIDRLRNERDAAVRQMEAAIPPHQWDPLALARGIGVEIAKLFGFAVFALALGPPRAKRGQPAEPEQTPWKLRVVEGGRATNQPATAQPVRPKRRWGWQAGLAAWLTMLTQPAPPVEAATEAAAPTGQATAPAKPPLELVVAADQGDDLSTTARALAQARWSERKIARELNVTRHRVRVWLGREKVAA